MFLLIVPCKLVTSTLNRRLHYSHTLPPRLLHNQWLLMALPHTRRIIHLTLHVHIPQRIIRRRATESNRQTTRPWTVEEHLSGLVDRKRVQITHVVGNRCATLARTHRESDD